MARDSRVFRVIGRRLGSADSGPLCPTEVRVRQRLALSPDRRCIVCIRERPNLLLDPTKCGLDRKAWPNRVDE